MNVDGLARAFVFVWLTWARICSICDLFVHVRVEERERDKEKERERILLFVLNHFLSLLSSTLL